MKKKVLAAILAATMVVGLTACGGSKDTTTTTPDAATEETTDDAAEAPAADASGMSFEIVSKGLQHQYWQAVKKGVEQKAAELGVTVNFVGPDSESNISQQVQQLESALNANPTAVGLAALDTESVKDLLQKDLTLVFRALRKDPYLQTALLTTTQQALWQQRRFTRQLRIR